MAFKKYNSKILKKCINGEDNSNFSEKRTNNRDGKRELFHGRNHVLFILYILCLALHVENSLFLILFNPKEDYKALCVLYCFRVLYLELFISDTSDYFLVKNPQTLYNPKI